MADFCRKKVIKSSSHHETERAETVFRILDQYSYNFLFVFVAVCQAPLPAFAEFLSRRTLAFRKIGGGATPRNNEVTQLHLDFFESLTSTTFVRFGRCCFSGLVGFLSFYFFCQFHPRLKQDLRRQREPQDDGFGGARMRNITLRWGDRGGHKGTWYSRSGVTNANGYSNIQS